MAYAVTGFTNNCHNRSQHQRPMSRQSTDGKYQEPSCFTENFVSMWIWVRHRMDTELRNRTNSMIAESRLISVRHNVDENKEKALREEESLMVEIRKKISTYKHLPIEQRTLQLKKLIPQMQRFKRFRQQGALARQQLTLLDAQINAFENGRFQKEMTDTLRASVVAMKQVGIADDSDVDKIFLDMEDNMQQQQDYTESLNMSITNSIDDGSNSDEMLMRELMSMASEDDIVTKSKSTDRLLDIENDSHVVSMSSPSPLTVESSALVAPMSISKPAVANSMQSPNEGADSETVPRILQHAT